MTNRWFAQFRIWLFAMLLTLPFMPFVILNAESSPIYDSFDDPLWDNTFNEELWQRSGDPGIGFKQENGRLAVIGTSSSNNSYTSLVARQFTRRTLHQLQHFESRLYVGGDPQGDWSSISVQIQSPDINGRFWWTNVVITAYPGQDLGTVNVSVGTQSQEQGVEVEFFETLRNVTLDDWHTLALEVEPSSATFRYLLDGELVNTYTPNDADALLVANNFEAAIVVGRATPGSTGIQYVDDVRLPQLNQDPYADKVVGYHALGENNTNKNAYTTLGPPNCGAGDDLSLGSGWVIVDMGAGEEIVDGSGVDLKIHESDQSDPTCCQICGASPYEAFASVSPDGPWASLGLGTGITSFDLQTSGLSSARFLKVQDKSPLDNLSSTPGADIDAFEALNSTVEALYSISGQVTDESDQCHSEIIISAGPNLNTTTTVSGSYTLTGLPAGIYTLAPSKEGCTFTPPTSQPITVPPNANEVDFGATPSKPTIVFVHGWNGISHSCNWPDPDAYFMSVDNEFELRERYNVKYVMLETSVCYTPPIDDNVRLLKEAIRQATQETNQSKVILVAHSMGGLVSRAYIEGEDYGNDVSALFTFGSPHFGIPLDVFIFLANGLTIDIVCDVQPGACDMSTVGMASFNLEYQPRNTGANSVAYHLITGSAPFLTRNPIGMALDSIIPGPDDGITPEYSGVGLLGPLSLAGTIDRYVTDEVHMKEFGSWSYFVRDGDQSRSYKECLKNVLLKGASGCTSSPIVQSAGERADAPIARTSLEQGTLLPGQIVTTTLPLEGTPTLFTAGWQTGTFSLQLIDPIGNLIDSEYALEHPDLVLYQYSNLGASYYITNTSAGAWKMVLRAITTALEGSNYTTFAAFDSDVTLTAALDQEWYGPGATVVITTSFTPVPANAIVTATIYRPDGMTDVVTLSPVGDGLYQTNYTVPPIQGYAEIRIKATGTTSEGIVIERGASQYFQITSTDFTLNGSYTDALYEFSPSAGYYGGIEITVGISAQFSGTVGLSADLVDSEGNFIAHSVVSEEVGVGTNTLHLLFSGDYIFASEQDGPYTLTNVLLTDKRGASIVAAEAKEVFETAPYSYRQFGSLGGIYFPLIER